MVDSAELIVHRNRPKKRILRALAEDRLVEMERGVVVSRKGPEE